ncbi:MAG: response regulator [Pseudomonadota bacterium]
MPGHVLLAEDEPHIAELLSFLLGRTGFAVAIETTGPAALKRALNEPPDVMILDVMLPELSGFDVLQRLRASEHGRDIPVVMLTAKGQREDRETAERLKVDVFITKPFSNAELIETVCRLARGKAA